MEKKRIIAFDYIRSICVIYIVGIWHLNNYLSPSLRFNGKVSFVLESIVVAVLATFSFVSGYFMRKYSFHSIRDVLLYYKKRFLRFWPLFFLASLGLYLIHWMDFKQFLLCVTGLSLFTATPVKTLWYISMLMPLYFVATPIIGYKAETFRQRLIRAFFMFLLVFILVALGISDRKLLLYSPLYFAGLLSRDIRLPFTKSLLVFISSSMIFILGLFFLKRAISFNQLSYLFSIFGTSSIIAFGFLLPKSRWTDNMFQRIAYASMAAYLFHRLFFGVVLFICWQQKEGEPYLSVFIACMTFILSLIGAWVIQRVYDIIVQKLQLSDRA